MNIKKYKWLLLLLAGVFVGCSSDDDNGPVTEEPVVITSGTADFSNFVSLGNSLTAGYTDGALFLEGQKKSLPNILAQQFALAGGGEFKQPLMSDNLGNLLLGGNVISDNRLFFNDTVPARLPGMPTTEITSPLTGSFNNMGVPGAKSFHLLAPGYGNVAGVMTRQANPYFVRFASSTNSTIIADAVAQQPSFFSLWIGINDVLSYAASGGDGVNQIDNINPATHGSNDITNPVVFENTYNKLVDTLTAKGAGGILANIPNVLKTPYFTTVPFKPLSPANPDFGPQIPTLNTTFAGLNQIFAALGVPERSIVFSSTDASAVVISDESLTNLSAQIKGALMQGGLDEGTATVFGLLYGQARQANASDLLVLPSLSIIGKLNTDAFDMFVSLGVPPQTAGQLAINGITYPLEDKWVLLTSEQQDVITATTAFNLIIKKASDDNGLAFVDVNAILDQIAETGVNFDEYSLNAKLIFGGTFGLDGVHPTARGYAYLANKFMESINVKYGSNLPAVKARDYNTVYPASL